MTRRAHKPALPWWTIGLVAVVGILMASPWFYGWIDEWAPYSRSASLEIGGALVGGAVVGAAFAVLERRMEAHRDNDQLLLMLRMNGDQRGVDLSNTDLSDRQLRRKVFDDAYFRDARLRNTDFTGGSFVRADFSGADLTGAIFDKADLTKARFVGATLTSAAMGSCIMDGTRFERAKLTRARIRAVNMMRCDMTGADLTGATLIDVDFCTSKTVGINLSDIKVDESTRAKHPNLVAIQAAECVPYEHPEFD